MPECFLQCLQAQLPWRGKYVPDPSQERRPEVTRSQDVRQFDFPIYQAAEHHHKLMGASNTEGKRLGYHGNRNREEQESKEPKCRRKSKEETDSETDQSSQG